MEERQKNEELDSIIKSNNWDVVRDYRLKRIDAFSVEVPQLQKEIKTTLKELNNKVDSQLKLYLILYLLATVLFAVDSINKISPKQN